MNEVSIIPPNTGKSNGKGVTGLNETVMSKSIAIVPPATGPSSQDNPPVRLP
jgi:hypothetical protein